MRPSFLALLTLVGCGGLSSPGGTLPGLAVGTPGGTAVGTPAGTSGGDGGGMPSGTSGGSPAGTASGTSAGTGAGTAAGTGAGTASGTAAGTTGGAPVADADGDGYDAPAFGGNDCDDTDPTVYPGAPELCDTIDNNCNGPIDEDQDGDLVNACVDCDNTDPTIYPGAPDTCGDGVDHDCDGQDCPAGTGTGTGTGGTGTGSGTGTGALGWSDDFETGTLGPDWSTSGNGTWFAQTSDVQAGSYGASSPNISDTQYASMTVVLDFPSGGTFEFWHKGSTEANYDHLQLWRNGTLVEEWSGSWGWTFESYAVPAGVSTAEFRYDKDISLDGGSDTVWLDEIVAIGGAP